MTAREGTQPPASPLVIDPGYAGLPDLAHGGYVAGVLTGALGAESSRVRLRRPVPPAQALRLERPRPGEIELHGDTGLSPTALRPTCCWTSRLRSRPQRRAPPPGASCVAGGIHSLTASPVGPPIRAACASFPARWRVAASSPRSGCRRWRSPERAATCRLARCRAIAENGEDWRGRAGVVAFAEAVTPAHADRPDDAARAFDHARAVLAAHKLRGEEAELLHEWGRLLGAPGRIDEAAELFLRHGAGRFWLDRVAADRRRPG